MTSHARGIGKCAQDHLGSYGYSTRPPEPYAFCSHCGYPMVWACPECAATLPDDSTELTAAHFCRECGASYFGEGRPIPPGEALDAPPEGSAAPAGEATA